MRNSIKKSKKININLNKKPKVLHIYNRAKKIGGRIYFISTGKKLKMDLLGWVMMLGIVIETY